jgi:IMP dehydrogenase/GMP reductase
MSIETKFKLGDIVNIKEGFGTLKDREMNPWEITEIAYDKNTKKINYHMHSNKLNAGTGFYEEALALAGSKETIEPKKYLELMNIPISLGFEDVAIKQSKNICLSRLDANIKSEFCRGIYLDIPISASNMSSVVDSDFCIRLRELGAIGVMHRALSKEEYLLETKRISDKCNITCCSIGVGNGQFELCKDLVNAGANIIIIDIAHGFSQPVIDLGRKIKKEIKDIKVIVGNTINVDMIACVADFADAVKVGIGQGSSCETKDTAACTDLQFSAVLKFKEVAKYYGIPIISDGGISKSSDMVKAIAAGANVVMLGKVLARCPESAGEVIEINGVRKKIHAGMSSRRVQDAWRQGLKKGTCTEGKAIYLDIGEPVADLIERYSGALRSGITYAGANDIKSFQDQVEFVRFK